MEWVYDAIRRKGITTYCVCALCMSELPEGVSPAEFAQIEFGFFNKPGFKGIFFQLWCRRHDCNITTIHIESDDWTHCDDAPMGMKLEKES